MKKSTLFFKVMVLLALLVPWTSWGQSLIDPGLPDGATQADIIGSRSMVLESDGSIPGENHEKGKNFQLSDFTEIGDNDLSGWSFTGNIFPEETGLSNVTVHGEQVQIKDKDAKPTVSAIYFEVKNNSTDETKWVVYGFAPAGTTVINKLTVSNSGKGSRPYNGKALTEDEVKNGLTVTATDTEGKPISDIEYTVSIPDNSVDAGTYTITVNITGEYAGQTTGTTTFEITKRPILVTLKDDAKLEFEIGTNEPTLAASEYLQATAVDGEEESGLISPETPTFTGNLSITDYNKDKAGDYTITQGNAAIAETGNDNFKLNNYNPTWNLDGAKVTVKKIQIGADDIKAYDETDGTKYFDATTKGYAVTYDGKNHGIGKVTATINGEEKVLEEGEGKDYIVSYTFEGKTVDTPVHVAGEPAPDQPQSYTATITLNSEKYEVTGTISGLITIGRRTLTISAKEGELVMLWNDGKQVLTASEYLKVTNWAEGESADIIGDLVATATEDGYTLTKGENTKISYDEKSIFSNDYSEDWTAVTTGIKVGNDKDPQTGETITIGSDGEGIEDVQLTNNLSKGYNGYTWKAEKLAGETIPEGATVTVKDEDGNMVEGGGMKNVGEYTIEVSYTDEDEVSHSGTATFTITPATLTVTVAEQSVEITDMASLSKDALSEKLTTTITENTNVTVGGLKGSDAVSFKGNSLTLADKEEWVLGENAEAITLAQDVTVTTDDEDNYNVTTVAGTLDVTFLINDENKDQFISLEGEDGSRVYDGTALDDEVSLNIPNVTEYEVTYAPKAEGGDEECADAGDYVATITVTIPEDSPYKIDGEGSLTVDYKITKRPLKLQFSFDTDIQEGETLKLGDNVSLEVADGASESNAENMGFAADEASEFNAWIGTEITATFKVHWDEHVNGQCPVELETITFPSENKEGDLKYANYDVSYIIMDANLEPGEDKPLLDDEKTPDEDGDYTHEGDEDDIIGGFEPVDNSGHGTITGTNYRKNRLYLADRDFYFNDLYDEEGLVLYSRHDKKYTEDGGSFTIWYEHNGEVNEGGYRIFISSKKNKDYKEVKLDEVSGYYQIRNVQSDIYVKIYAMDGFPVANEEITATDARAYAQANKIVVITPEPTDVQIISMAGAVVATDQVTGQREFANLTEGVYLVRMGETVIKLQVRN